MHKSFHIGLGLLAAAVLAACNSSNHSNPGASPGGHTQGQGITNGVVKVQAVIPVVMDGAGNIVRINAKIDNPVTIINPTAVNFALDGNAITAPPITNALLDFGKLKIGELLDNALNVCGANGKTRCTKAYIQLYTTGTPGAGIWNTELAWGAPIYSNMTGSTRLTVGLGVANAAVVQQFALPTTKNVLRLSDFPAAAAYEMRADFTNAGAGTYNTTLVVEYGLLL